MPFFSMKFQNLITRFLLFRYPIYHYYYNEKSTFWCKALPFLLVLTQQIGLRLKFLKLHHDFPIWFKNKMAFSKISVNLNQALCPKSQCHVVVDGSNMCGKKPIDCCCCWLCWWGAGRASSIVLTTYHSSKISACCLMKLSVKKKHQYFWNKKTWIKKLLYY